MPAEDSSEERRGWPLPTIALWVGMGLAALSALLVLVAQGGGVLRLAAVCAIFSVVMIGYSLTVRSDPESARAAMEESLIEEIEELRTDLRKDIETAARATHRAFGEKLQVLQNELRAVRTQVAAQSAGVPAQPNVQPNAAPGPTRGAAGAARVAGVPAGPATGPAGPAAGTARAAAAPPFAERPAGPGTAPGPGWSGPPEMGPPGHGFGPQPHMATGVVRHTETVKVTTRQTIVDAMPDSGRDAGYGSHGPGAGYGTGMNPVVSAGTYRSGSVDDGAYDLDAAEDDRYGTGSADHGRHRDHGADQGWRDHHPRGDGSPGSGHGDPAGAGSWTDARVGARWASVRSGAWGSQVRTGERHAALRTDESGSELHMADRWSNVRQYEQPAGRHGRAAEQPGGPYPAGGPGGERSARHRRDPDPQYDGGSFPSGAPGGRHGRQSTEPGWGEPGWGEQSWHEPGDPDWAERNQPGWGEPAEPGFREAAWASAAPDHRRAVDRGPYGGGEGEWYGPPPADEVPRAGGARGGNLYPADGRWR